MTKKSLATPTNILENTRQWRRTYKGLTANLYAKVRERARKKVDRRHDEFTLGQFRAWFENNDGRRLWLRWRSNGYLREERPSVDRIDPLDGYRFENLQLLTASANRRKGDAEKLVLWGKPVRQIDCQNHIVATYPSLKQASEITKINKNNISSVINGKRKTAGGYKWEVIGNIYENPELLEYSK